MGLAVTVFLTVEAIVFWQLGTLAKTDAVAVAANPGFVSRCLSCHGVNSYTYIFFGPVIAEILIAACLGMAIFTAKAAEPGRPASSPPAAFRPGIAGLLDSRARTERLSLVATGAMYTGPPQHSSWARIQPIVPGGERASEPD